MSSPAGAALLAKIALTMSNADAGQIPAFLTLAEAWDMRELAFDLPSTITGISERDSVNLRGSFARRVNSVPAIGDTWSSTGTYLWDVYRDVLQGAIVLAEAPDSDADEDRVRAARALIGPPDTPQYQTYVAYRDQCRMLERSVRLAEVTLANATDPIVQAQAQVDRDEYRNQLNAASQEWIARGYKAEVEAAMQTLTEAFARSALRRWTFWQTEFSLVTSQSDSYGSFWPTGYRPDRLYDLGAGWITFTLSSSEVAALAASAPPEVQRTQDALGDAVRAAGEIQQLSMEIARIDIERPWFHPELFASRFWKWSIPDQAPLADGGQPIQRGILPGYVIGLVLVRNISITWHTPASSTADPSIFRVLGNFALPREALIQVAQRQILRPVPAEVFRQSGVVTDPRPIDPSALERYKSSVFDPRTVQAFVTSPILKRTLTDHAMRINPGIAAPSLAARMLARNVTHRWPPIVTNDDQRPSLASNTTGSHSTGDAVYLVAYIVQRTPKSPDPDPSLTWPL